MTVMAPLHDTNTPFTVAVDAMGGDYAPTEVVKGAIEAVSRGDVQVVLVGDPSVVEAEMNAHDPGGVPITMAPAEGLILETDHPVTALRRKPHASVIEAVRLVKAEKAQAAVTMGSTGAAMASAALVLGLMEGVERPVLGGPLLRPLSQTTLVDLGTSVDCRPTQLLGFAAIGCALARSLQGISDPRIALLSIGAEAKKGNRQIQAAYPLFEESGLTFVGNIEGNDLFTNRADVVICDGFVGNVLLKFGEGLSLALTNQLSKLLGSRLPAQELSRLEQEVHALTNAAEQLGGGPLLGVDGIVIVGHGRAKAPSVASAIAMAKWTADRGLVEGVRQELARVNASQRGPVGRA